MLSYDRGFRHDDRRPVVIPEKVALACEAVSARALASSEPSSAARRSSEAPCVAERLLPVWNDLSSDITVQVLAARGAQPAFTELPPEQVFLTKLDRFAPFAQEIGAWLAEHADKGHRLRVLNGTAPVRVPIVVLEVADPDQAVAFKIRWYGAGCDSEERP